jgi:hypothetical protein
MSHVVAIFAPPLMRLPEGRVYTAQACGRERDDGRWEGWLEFLPDNGSLVLRTERETTQRNLRDLEYWAGGLTPVYLQGALERSLTPRPIAVEPPEIPAVYDEPAPPESVLISVMPPETEAVLDPFSVYAQGEEALARRLGALSPRHLRTIILEYELGDSSNVDLETLTTPELVGWIIGAVRGRLAA